MEKKTKDFFVGFIYVKGKYMAKKNQWRFVINSLEKLWGFPFLLIFQK
jgi:hypothetical protein